MTDELTCDKEFTCDKCKKAFQLADGAALISPGILGLEQEEDVALCPTCCNDFRMAAAMEYLKTPAGRAHMRKKDRKREKRKAKRERNR
jgi:hypothetical protein